MNDATETAGTQARLNITYAGCNGDLPDPIAYDLPDAAVREIATEAVRQGYVRNVPARPDASFEDFVVERFDATGDLPNRIMLRPKTPFGSASEWSDYADLRNDLSNAVYKAAVKFYEGAEHRRWISGNGHHMAQYLAQIACAFLDERKVGRDPSALCPVDALVTELSRR